MVYGAENCTQVLKNSVTKMTSNKVQHRRKLDERKTGLKLHSAYVIKQHPGTDSTLQACQMFNTELEFLPWIGSPQWCSFECPSLNAINMMGHEDTAFPLYALLESVTPEQDVFMKQWRLMSFPFLFLLVLATINHASYSSNWTAVTHCACQFKFGRL